MWKKIYFWLKQKSERSERSGFKGRLLFLATGLAATVWFLVRVIPKPSRATYPCMQAAAPLMSSFVVYLLGVFGGVGLWRQLCLSWRRRRYVWAAACSALLLACAGLVAVSQTGVSWAALNPFAEAPRQVLEPNRPVGEARGIFPGRVVWSHAPGAASWEGTGGHWFEDRFNNQVDCDWLIAQTLLELTGQHTGKEAWQAIFSYYNRSHGLGDGGYRKGQKVAIKVNQNNTYSHADSEEINASPQLVLSLLSSLIEEGGVGQEDITVSDPSRFITDYLYDKCHARFPGVRFVDNQGGDGRIKSEYAADAMHYSQDNGPLARGICTVFTEADYVINMALLKGHVGQGVTLCGKNWYGAMSIHNDWRKNHHNNFNQDRTGKPKYMTFVDFMGHKDLGGKTVLWLIDGLYGSKNVGGKPAPKWSMEPFDGNWPCSLLGSLDPVAIDMVANDFLISQFPAMADVNYSDMYLSEAAQAGHAPSGVKYDPDGMGRGISSLGVAEHWNNATDKQYSRNLGRQEGIELVYQRR